MKNEVATAKMVREVFLGAAYLYAGTSTYRVVCGSVCPSPIFKQDQ